MTSPPHGASKDHPRATIVIVNKDDERVAETLARLADLEPRDAEVVVVDASSHRLDHVRDRFPTVTWLAFEAPAGRRTIAEQRNAGVAASRGAVVVFLDANCLPDPGWLERLLSPIEAGGEAIVAGRIASSEPDSIHDRSSLQGGGAPGYLEECACMNVAFRRDVFATVGVFDESLGYAEDFDLAWRARDAGLAIRFEPTALVRHHFGDTAEDLPRAFRYGVGRVRLYRKHPSRLRQLAGRDRYVAAYCLFVLCSPLALAYPAYLGLLAYPLVRNRGTHPVRTVTYHLVYALGVLSEAAGVRILPGQRR